MFVSRLQLEHFGLLDHFETELYSRNVLFSGTGSETVAQAVRLLSGSCFLSSRQLRLRSRLYAEIETDRLYRVEAAGGTTQWLLKASDFHTGADCTQAYLDSVACCAEEEAVSCFAAWQKADFPHRLCRYIRAERENDREFRKSTAGAGFTDAFRGYLKHYIQHFEPQLLQPDKPYQLVLSPAGAFTVVHPEAPDTVFYLSDIENRLYHFLCFLNLAEFWAGFEAIRDMHHVQKPLFISEFFEFLPQDTDMTGEWERIASLGRQVFICTPSSGSGLKMPPDMQAIQI